MKKLLSMLLSATLVFSAATSTTVLAVAPSPEAEGKTYYVDDTGSNENDGLSEAKAFQTVQHGLDQLKAGDTLVILPGNYNEKVSVPTSGEPDKPITITGKEGEEKPVIDGTGVTDGDGSNITGGIFLINSQSHIVVKDIKLQNSYFNTLIVAGPDTKDITIDGVETYQSSSTAIMVNGNVGALASDDEVIESLDADRYDGVQGITVRNCVIEKSHYLDIVGRSYNETISVTSGVSDILIENNTIRESGCPGFRIGGPVGIDVKCGISDAVIRYNDISDIKTSAGIYVDAWNRSCRNVEVYGNYIHDLTDNFNGGIQVNAERYGYLDNIKIYNNIITRANYGIMASEQDAKAKDHYTGIQVYNNTIVNNKRSGILLQTNTAEINIHNNIVAYNTEKSLEVKSKNPNIVTSHNLFYQEGEKANSFFGTYFLTEEPAFAGDLQQINTWTPEDMKLTENSPALNRAKEEIQLDKDYGKDTRPIGDKNDLGAWEYQEETPENPWPEGSDQPIGGGEAEEIVPITVDPSENLATNGDFEEGFSFGEDWANWGHVELTDEDAHSGSYSIRYDGTKGGGGFARVLLGADQKVQAGVKYRFSAWVNSPKVYDEESMKNGGAIQMLFLDKDGTRLGIESIEIDSTDGWTKYEGEVIAPEETAQIQFCTWIDVQDGPMYLDDFELYAIGGENTIITDETYDMLEGEGDFEDPISWDGNDNHNGWANWGGAEVMEDPSLAHSGNFCLKVPVPLEGTGFTYAVHGVVPGVEYTLKLWAKMDGKTHINSETLLPIASFSMIFKDHDGLRLNSEVEAAPIMSVGDWVQYEVKAVAPEGAYRMEPHLWAQSSHDNLVTIYVDEFELYTTDYPGKGEVEPEPADKAALQKLVDEAAKIENDGYTEASWDVFVTALESAKAVLADEKATQEQVDAAVKALEEAKANLKKDSGENPGDKPGTDPDDENPGDKPDTDPDDGKPGENPENPDDGKTPQTGDNGVAVVLAVLAMVSAVCGIWMLRQKVQKQF